MKISGHLGDWPLLSFGEEQKPRKVVFEVQFSGKSTPFLLLSALPCAEGFSRKCFVTKMKLGMFVNPSIRVPWVITLDLTSGIGVWSSAMERNIGKLHFSTSLNLCTLQNEKPVTWEHVKKCSSSPIHKCQSDRDALSLPIIPARVSQFGQPSAGLIGLWRNRVLEQSWGGAQTCVNWSRFHFIWININITSACILKFPFLILGIYPADRLWRCEQRWVSQVVHLQQDSFRDKVEAGLGKSWYIL